jgi:hypothetical protein
MLRRPGSRSHPVRSYLRGACAPHGCNPKLGKPNASLVRAALAEYLALQDGD